jgi:hypothetical protein
MKEPRYLRFYKMMHCMERQELVRYIQERGLLLATGECGICWYNVQGLVWCVRSATQADYDGLIEAYQTPKYAHSVM